MKERDIVSLVILALLCVLSMANIIWMIIINHLDLAIGSAVMFAVFSITFMYEVKNK
jgi:hypothetical protein